MDINQTVSQVEINNHSTFDVVGHGLSFSAAQGYCIIFCVTLILITSIIMISRLIQTAILRVNYISPKTLQKLKEEILEELK
jgi:hypothetical protein